MYKHALCACCINSVPFPPEVPSAGKPSKAKAQSCKQQQSSDYYLKVMSGQ